MLHNLKIVITDVCMTKFSTYSQTDRIPIFQLNLAWKRRHAPAAKRVLIVGCGVALASICSPVIAAVSVSVG